jgi:hypothetical protein
MIFFMFCFRAFPGASHMPEISFLINVAYLLSLKIFKYVRVSSTLHFDI